MKERLKLYYRREDVLQIERLDGITRITLKLYKKQSSKEAMEYKDDL